MEEVRILGRDQILKARDLKKELVHVPEWADPESGAAHVYVRALTGAERDAFEESLVQERVIGRGRRRETTRTVNMRNARAKLCSLSMVDADGNRLFSDADVRELGQKSASALNRVFDVAQRLSGLSDDDLEELTGNLESDDPSDDSISA